MALPKAMFVFYEASTNNILEEKKIERQPFYLLNV